MSGPARHNTIDYIELTTTDIARSEAFYGGVFGWKFQDYGADYASFDRSSAGVDGGFRTAAPAKRSAAAEQSAPAAPLVVLYSSDLKATEEAIVAAGGRVVVPVFEFPGGRRFHFDDGAGNTLAVWSE